MIGYLRRHGTEGTHLVLWAHVQRNTDAFDKVPLLRQLYGLAPLVRQDIILLLAACALALNLPHLVIVGGVLALASAATIITLVLRKTEGPQRATEASSWLSNGFTLLGAAILVGLISRVPLGEIADVWSAMGWGIALTPLIALTWCAANTYGLSALARGQARWSVLFSCRMMGEGYNALTSLGAEGGEPVKVRQLRRDLSQADAYSVLVLGRALQILSGLVFSAVCLAVSLVAFDWPRGVTSASIAYLVVAIGLAYAVARFAVGQEPRWFGAWLLARLGARGDEALGGVGLRALMSALIWHLTGRAVLTVEIAWLMHLLGVAHDPLTIIAVTGIVSVGAVFSIVIPQSLGIAEAAAVFAFSLFGLPAVMGLAFGLVRRARMLLLSFLGVAWHHAVVAVERRGGRAELVRAPDVSPKPQS
jgi:hypothetical protein